MKPFLYNTAKHLWETHGEEISNFKIVFPNKRSSLYFKQYLKLFASNYFIVPECLIINDLITNQSEKVVADKLTLTGKLFQVFKEVTKTDESFSEFYPFANLLLGDFDSVDKHLVDTRQLFRNISSLQEIDNSLSYLSEEQLTAIKQFWKSFDIATHSQHQQLFLKMWKALPEVYIKFNEALAQEGISYEGRIFREVVDSLAEGHTTLTDNPTVFVGFNVLSKAEKEIFRILKNENKATFYWDYDRYFTDDEYNEAGRFISKNIKEFPNPETFNKPNKIDENKDVYHIECSTEVQQTKVLGELLAKLSPDELSNSVIVLANEELLPTVLSSLPHNLENVNISMGYPLKETTWMQFLELWVTMHKTMIWHNNVACFSSETIQKILQHPYALYFNQEEVKALENKILKGNKAWVTAESIPGKLSRMLKPIEKQEDSYIHLKKLLSFLFAKTDPNSTDRELMIRTSTLSLRIHDVLKRVKINAQQFFWTLLLEELSQQRMPFQASEEKNLQIIGFLETRLLDFENVFILSANENYLPNIQLAGSLIPYNLRVGAGLPTLDEQNSMYAYYFYRLLSRAKRMALFSVSGSEEMQSKEKSRYITQLMYEAPFKVKQLVAQASLEWVKPKPKDIVKTDYVVNKFDEYYNHKRSLSPSAINRYLRCPQNFYYRYIKGIKEVQLLSKADDNNMFGSIFHKAAELLYKPYIHNVISEDLINKIGKPSNVDSIILQAFKEELFANEDRELRGKEWLIFDTLKHLLNQLLTRDKKHVPFVIKGLEEKMESSLEIVVNGEKHVINLYGSIDRIDEKDGVTRVIDYKTGYINRGFKSIEDLFEACGKNRNPTALQTFFYSWLYLQNTGDFASPTVYHLKEIEKDVLYEFKMGEARKKEPFVFSEHSEEYEKHLKILLGEMFGNEPIFYRTDDKKECEHDAHTGICTVFSGN